VVGITVSSLTARYLGTHDFGVLSYVLWLTGMIALVTDLGLDQLLRKYVPAWFHEPETRAWAVRMAWRAIAIQFGAAALLVALLLATFPWWGRTLTIAYPRLQLVMAIGMITVLPMVVSRCVATFLRSIQTTGVLARVTLASQATNLILVLTAVALRLPLEAFAAVGLVAQTILAFGLVTALRRQPPPPPGAQRPVAEWPRREFTRYALIAYANVLLQQVVWSRSETFFLGIYSPAQEVGFYGLAYGIAGIIAGLVGICQQALFAAQFRLLAADQEERSDRIASLSIKYLGIAFLPSCLVCWLFMDSIVRLLYGPDYPVVARIFPFVLLGTVVANILNPVATKVHLSNVKFAATLGIGLAGAAINVTLDLLLIPAHHAWGAAVANCLSQVSVMAIGMTFVARVSPVRLDLRSLVVVGVVNGMLGAVVWLLLAHANVLPLKVAVTVVIAALYLRWLTAWGVFNREDREILCTLEEHSPPWLRPAFQLVRNGLGAAA
jgi:O-antigen/teichoic acid export membrane protein